MKILYFTSTGNCLYVAKKIGDECYSIPRMMKEDRYEFEDDIIGIVLPTYVLGVPEIAEEFLNKVKLKSKYIFGILTYGKMSGAVTDALFDIGIRNDIEFSYINEILMVDNYLPVFDIDKEIEIEPNKNIEGSLETIINDIKNKKNYIKSNSKFTKFISKFAVNALLPIQDKVLFKDTKIFENNFYIEDACNGCGICAKVCPVDNIKIEDKNPKYQGSCIKCLACINHCSQNAIRLNCEKSKARFINQNITLKEIINSNN